MDVCTCMQDCTLLCIVVYRYIVEEEKQIDAISQRRVYGGGGGGVIQRDPNAPEKPTRNPAVMGPPMNRVPSDSHVKRLSALSLTNDDPRLFDDRGVRLG